jgi:hypothetical protein
MGSRELKLNEFKALHKWLTRNTPDWLAFLVLGFLVWVEEKFINQRIKTEIDSAIKEYNTVDPPKVVIPEPVYSETGDSFFDEMRLSAPWVDREHPSDSP